MRKFVLVFAALAAGTLAAGCGSGGTAPGTTSTTSARTTSAVIYGNAFQLAGPIHGLCTATHSDSAKTGTVTCGLDITNQVNLAVKLPPGTWKTYSISYSGTPIRPVQKLVSKGYLYLGFVGQVNDTINKVTFTS